MSRMLVTFSDCVAIHMDEWESNFPDAHIDIWMAEKHRFIEALAIELWYEPNHQRAFQFAVNEC